jgi:hypothetical protein
MQLTGVWSNDLLRHTKIKVIHLPKTNRWHHRVADFSVPFCAVHGAVVAQQVARRLHGAGSDVPHTAIPATPTAFFPWCGHVLLLLANREAESSAVGANDEVGAVGAVVALAGQACVLRGYGDKRNAVVTRVCSVDLAVPAADVNTAVGAQQQTDGGSGDDDAGQMQM